MLLLSPIIIMVLLPSFIRSIKDIQILLAKNGEMEFIEIHEALDISRGMLITYLNALVENEVVILRKEKNDSVKVLSFYRLRPGGPPKRQKQKENIIGDFMPA